MRSRQHKKTGFTLIELLISTTLIALLMLGISSLFMTFLLGSAKTNTRKTVKDEGVHALSQMEFLIKNARYVDEVTNSRTCVPNMSVIDIVSIDNGLTTLRATGSPSKIASNSSYLTSDAVTISSGPIFNCTGVAGNRQIEIDFTLDKTTPDGIVSESFNSIVNVRN